MFFTKTSGDEENSHKSPPIIHDPDKAEQEDMERECAGSGSPN